MALLFNTNTSLSCLEIEVKDDPIFEPPEQFTLHLNTSTAFVILRPNTAVIKIADNDGELLLFHTHTANYSKH